MKKLLLQFFFLSVFILVGNSQNLVEFAKLEASDQQGDDNHGISVAVSGDYAIAGAWHEDHDAAGENFLNNAGAAYIYHFNDATNEWLEETKIVAADRETLDAFGTSVDISGTYVVVGAVDENGARGAAYVFERNNLGVWEQVEKLEAPTNQANDRFGKALAISGDRIVVGAHHEDEDENEINTKQNAGSAYIFDRGTSGWDFAKKIVASDRDVNHEFGFSVGIHDERIIVGAYRYNIENSSDEIGSAYAFEIIGGEWTEVKVLNAATPFADDRFGWSVDINYPYYIVGAPYHDYDDSGGEFHNNAGAAYIFDATNSWAEDKVVEGNRRDQDNLGEDVVVYNTRAFVGAPLQDTDIDGEPPILSSSGAVFIYDKDENGFWNQTQKLLTGDRFAGDKFGHAVDFDGITFVGGAPEDNQDDPTPMPSTGAVYIFKNEPLGISNFDSKDTWSVYPNPTNGAITISLDKKYKEIDLSIYNALGQLIVSKKFREINSLNFTIEGLSGLYLVNLLTNDGKFTSKKIVKK